MQKLWAVRKHDADLISLTYSQLFESIGTSVGVTSYLIIGELLILETEKDFVAIPFCPIIDQLSQYPRRTYFFHPKPP
jgi:hypothetical protein